MMSAPHPLVPYEERRSYSTKNIPCDKLYCECGHNNQAKILGIHNNWALWLVCSSPTCMRTWYICNECTNSRSKITTKQAMVRHYKDLHLKKKKVSNDFLMKRARVADDSSQGMISAEDNSGYCLPNDLEENSVTSNEMIEQHKNLVLPVTDEESQQSRFDINYPIRRGDVRNPKNIGFNNNASKEYFANCYRVGEGEWGGLQYLVRRSVAQDDYQDTEMDKIDIPLEHCNLHMKIARLSFLLSKKEWSLLTDVINSVWQVGCEDGYKAATLHINSDMNILYMNDDLDIIPDFVRHRLARPYNSDMVKRSPHKRGIVIPDTSNDIRKYYTEGRFSVLQNMPCPNVFGDAVPGHSYVSIIDCIRDFMAHTGTGKIAAAASDSVMSLSENGVVNDTVKSRHIVETVRRAQDNDFVRSMKPLVCMVFFWSDDFEPNGMSKGMRGSAWIKTMTILTRHENGQSSTHTYPISLGLKNDSHDEVEAAINNEMRLIQNGSVGPFYEGIARKMVHLFFDVHATLQDQPERRGANGLGGGASKFHARWGISGNHTELFNVLKCCNACLKIMQERYSEKQCVLALPDCNQCLCWDILSKSILSKNTLPKHYPLTIGNAKSRLIKYDDKYYLRPFRITYQSLKAAIIEAHNNYLSTKWNAHNCLAFLKVEGLNDNMIDTFLDHAVNEASLTTVLEEEERLQLEIQKEMNPRLFERVPFLALWDRGDVELTSHPDVIMHLLFLGVVKTTVHTVKKWLSCIGKNKSFLNSNEALLGSFKPFSLDWLRILPFKGPKLGGWVSENYLGFSRIILWFYQNIEGAAAIIDNAPPDNIQQKNWLLKHNKFWLRSRGLNYDGTAPELSKRVAEYLAKNPVPEPLDQPTRKIEDVELALVTLTRLLRCVMADIVSDESIMETDYCVRIFLSHFSSLSATTWTPGEQKKEARVQVISSFNFICLMNLPDAMKRYGPLRHLWEGSFRGEGFLRQTKPQMMQGFKSNWHINLHRNILHEKAFQNIFEGCDSKKNQCCHQSILSENARNIHSYDSPYEVRDVLLEVMMQKKRPLSVFAVRSERCPARLFAKMKYSDCVTQIRLVKANTTNKNDHKTKFGLAYFEFESQNIQDYTDWATDIEPELGPETSIVFGVLLPLLEKDNCIDSRKFALVSSTWKNLEPQKTLDSIF